MRHYISVEERFWAHVNKTDNCWLWTGSVNSKGYGLIYVGKVDGRSKSALAHRFAASLLLPDFDEARHVLHQCDVRNCVRPDHLFIGDQLANMRDMVSKGRHHYLARSYCKNGHDLSVWRDERPGKVRRCRACHNIHRSQK